MQRKNDEMAQKWQALEFEFFLTGKCFVDVKAVITQQRYNKWFTIRTYVILCIVVLQNVLILIATGNKV